MPGGVNAHHLSYVITKLASCSSVSVRVLKSWWEDQKGKDEIQFPPHADPYSESIKVDRKLNNIF